MLGDEIFPHEEALLRNEVELEAFRVYIIHIALNVHEWYTKAYLFQSK